MCFSSHIPIEETNPSNGSAWIVWYPSHYRSWDASAKRWIRDPSFLVEVVELPAEYAEKPSYSAAGHIVCRNTQEAIAEVPFLPLSEGLLIWRGVFSVRRVQDAYPHQWHRLATPSPGQEWPDDWVTLGGCLECGATGLCPDCGGADAYPDADLYETDFSHTPTRTDLDFDDDDAYYGDMCICEEDGLCLVCHGTRLQPAPSWYQIARGSLGGTRRAVEENRQSIAEEEYAWERRWERLLQTPWEHRFQKGDYNEREWHAISVRNRS